MTQTLYSIIESEIEKEKHATPRLHVSVSELARIAQQKLGIQIHREQIRRILNDMGYQAEDGKKRSWIWRHKEG
jgi:phenylalanyl-tRNA synthetase beta subunit